MKLLQLEIFITILSLGNVPILVDKQKSVSIATVLSENNEFLEKVDDEFLTDILCETEANIVLLEKIEMRLVNIVNTSLSDNTNNKLYKYIIKHKNKINITVQSVKYAFNDCSFLMCYNEHDINILRQILLKNKDNDYRKKMKQYAETQGYINNNILYNCIVLDITNCVYVNNIDVNLLKQNICYKHIMEFVSKSKILQRYFVSKKDIDFILRFPQNISIEDFLDVLTNRVHKITDYKLYNDVVIFIFLINRKLTTIFDIHKIDEFTKGEGFFYNEYYRIQKQNFNTAGQTLGCYKRDIVNYKLQNELGYNQFIDNTVNKKHINMKKQSKEVKNNLVITNSFNIDLTDIKSKLEYLQDVKHKKYLDHMICKQLDFFVAAYDFKTNFEILLAIVKFYKSVKIISKIQKYIIKIMDEGFFEDCYFDMIHKLYNKLVLDCQSTLLKKNNDIIMIKLSKFGPFFDKKVCIANIKH